MLEKRLNLPTRAVAEEKITQHFSAQNFAQRFSTIGAYVPIRGEVDIMPLMALASRLGAHLALPHIDDNDTMTFRRWHPKDPLIPGRYRIPSPANSDTVIPDLLLLPLLACDHQGCRLGAGGGYYDRTLVDASYKNTYLLGVGFHFQLLPLLPSEAHDVRVHAFLSEEGIVTFGNNA